MKSNFWVLYKAQLSAMLWTGRKNAKNKKSVKARSAGGTLVAWLVVGVIIAVYEFIFMNILYVEGNTEIFPPIVAMFAMFLTLVTSVSYAKTLLFEAKDHDLLFSLPLSGRTIVAAKLATMYTLDSILNLIMLVPCGIYYAVLARPQITFYVYYFILIFFVSLIPILVASVISALMSLVASRFRHAQLVTIVLYAVFLCGVMSVSFTVGSGTEEEAMIGPMFAETLENVRVIYPPVGWFADAIMEKSLSSALLFVGVSLLAFAVVAIVFGKFYGKIHEVFRPRTVRRGYRSSEKSSGIMIALMKKDMKRIVSSANVFMNQLVGLLMLVVFAVMFSIQDFGTEGEAIGEMFSLIFPFVFAMAAAMVNDTTTAISLEGKAFPILKSLPIPPKTIIRAKLYLHMAFCGPVILACGIAVVLVNHLPLIGAAATVVIPLCYAYTAGIVGLLIDLKKYKFDWTSEIMIVKNNLPTVITMIGGMLLSIVSMIISIVLCTIGIPMTVVLGFFSLLAAIIAALMTVVLNTVGEKLFLKIEY